MSRRSHLMRFAALSLLVITTPFLAGCGMVFGGTRQVVRASSSPEGAEIVSNPPTSTYTTPASMSLERKNNYSLTFSLPGYKSSSLELQKSIRGGIVVLDILFGLVPLIVDAATGSWYKLSPEVAQVTLTKLSADVQGPDKIELSISLKAEKETADVRVDSSVPGVSISVDAH